MATQAELDKDQERTKSQSGTIGKIRRGGIHDIDTQPRQDDNKEGTDERIQNDGIDQITSPLKEDEGGGGGSGLPEYPGEEPSLEIKAPLVWDGDNDEARWLVGETQSASDEKSYLDVFGYDPDISEDKFTLARYERLSVIICKDGEPVTGQILFFEEEVAP